MVRRYLVPGEKVSVDGAQSDEERGKEREQVHRARVWGCAVPMAPMPSLDFCSRCAADCGNLHGTVTTLAVCKEEE